MIFMSLGCLVTFAEGDVKQPVQPANAPMPLSLPMPSMDLPMPKGILPPPGKGPGLGSLPLPPPQLGMPPAFLIRGKEFDLSRVLIENAKVGKEIKIEFLMFDRDPNEKLTSKAYGLPQSASYKVEVSQSAKNSGSAVFNWTPSESDIGVKGIAFEVTNGKESTNRIALFFDVKP